VLIHHPLDVAEEKLALQRRKSSRSPMNARVSPSEAREAVAFRWSASLSGERRPT